MANSRLATVFVLTAYGMLGSPPTAGDVSPADSFAYRIGSREILAREGLVDDRNVRRSFAITIGEIAARLQRDSRSPEVAWTYALHPDVLILAGGRGIAFRRDAALARAAPKSPKREKLTPSTPGIAESRSCNRRRRPTVLPQTSAVSRDISRPRRPIETRAAGGDQGPGSRHSGRRASHERLARARSAR